MNPAKSLDIFYRFMRIDFARVFPWLGKKKRACDLQALKL